MDYIAVLEYEHLDNGMFLNAFAQALSRKNSRGIIIHGDSEYTERIIQTGVMREEATIRAVKDLNHRLVALFADQGISTIAVNGHQKSLLRFEENSVEVDLQQLKKFPSQPVILLSALAVENGTGRVIPVPLPDLARTLKTSLDISEEITVFSIHEASEIIKDELPVVVKPGDLDESYKKKHLPVNFRNVQFPLRITSAQHFSANK
ncbi:MAG: hypothetical protein WEA56_09970 [Balneolaceae bacterium]